MIVQPDFFDHWKTKALIELTKRPDSPLWVLRLWAHCQARKDSRFRLPAIALKAICGVPQEIDADTWFAHLKSCRFIEGKPDRWTVHGWDEYNASLLARWSNGRQPKQKRTRSEPEAEPKQKQRSHGDRVDGLDGEEGLGESRGKNTPKPPRAARSGSKVGIDPSVQSEVVRNRMLAINALKGRLPSTRWSRKEFDAFESAGLHVMFDTDFSEQIAPLAAYYGAPLPLLQEFWRAADTGADFRRRDLQTLLNNWPGEVDRAREWVHWRCKKSEGDAAGRL